MPRHRVEQFCTVIAKKNVKFPLFKLRFSTYPLILEADFNNESRKRISTVTNFPAK